MSYVKIRVQAVLTTGSPSKAPSDDEVEQAVVQCVGDAGGSLDDLPTASKPSNVRGMAELLSSPNIEKSAEGARRVEFLFGLPEWMFPVGSGGIQHLVGVLASDAFPSQVENVFVSGVEVKDVEIPDRMLEELHNVFTSKGHTIADIRRHFQLADQKEPLVAFSFKPRVGFDMHFARKVTREVVEEGVSIVEFDTRHLQDPRNALPDWTALATAASEAAESKKRVATFAPNLSHQSALAIELALQWCDADAMPGPRVVKVDGGLDGLSIIQGIRSRSQKQPIITTYPLLRSTLKRYLGSSDAWVRFLSLSGSDIIYPGNRPQFPQEHRRVGGDEVAGLRAAARRYREFAKVGRPMPSFAAGADPAHLHAAYELLGPEVSYFLGGAIVHHPDGPRSGARLCVRILEMARENARTAAEKGRDYGEELPPKLVKEIVNLGPSMQAESIEGIEKRCPGARYLYRRCLRGVWLRIP